jgi:selenocysteine lyase/cysteine desulfurase
MVYHRSLIPPLVARSKERACDYLQLKGRDGFSFVSVTEALFGVLKSIRFQPGDIIVVTSDTIYHSVVDALLYLSQKHQLTWLQVETPEGAKLDDIYREFDLTLQRNKQKVKLVIFDHISSKPSVLFPVQKICQLCKSLKIPTLVDGAHVPGSVPYQHIHIEQTGATFYAVTFHKWCNTPRGGASGGLWVNKRDVKDVYNEYIDISSLVVHGGWVDDDSPENRMQLYLDHSSKPGYFTDGLTQGIYDESTREYENILVLPHCLDLVLRFDAEFQEHVKHLRITSMKLLKEVWDLSDDEAMLWYGDLRGDFDLSMLSVPLPTQQLIRATRFSSLEKSSLALGKKLNLLKKNIVLQLWRKYAIEVPVFVWKDTLLGVRLSFGRHVQLIDIQRLGTAFVQMIKEGMTV